MIAPVLLIAVVLHIKPTLAYLEASMSEVVNTFFPTKVETELEEDLEGDVKKSITVEYTGTTAGYVRVQLVPELRDKEGNLVAEQISMDDFEFSKGDMTNWIESDGYYYYKKVVQPSENHPKLQLPITNISVKDLGSYKENIPVLSVLVQTVDELHVEEAWKVTLSGGVIES